MATDEMTLHDWLRTSRQIRGLTLTGIADAAGASNQSNLSKAERGLIVPEPETMEKLAPFYGSPWLSKEENIGLMHAVCWVLTSRIGFHPVTDEEFETVSDVQKSLTASRRAVAEVPFDPGLRLRITAMQFRGVPGLAGLDWDSTGPFWMWVWWHQMKNIKLGRERLEYVKIDVQEYRYTRMRQDFARLVSRQRREEAYLQKWPDEIAINGTLSSLSEELRAPNIAWYQYPRLNSEDYQGEEYEEEDVDLENETEGGTDFTPIAQKAPIPANSEKMERIELLAKQLLERSERNPAFLNVIDKLLQYPPNIVTALDNFLSELGSPPQPPDDLPF